MHSSSSKIYANYSISLLVNSNNAFNTTQVASSFNISTNLLNTVSSGKFLEFFINAFLILFVKYLVVFALYSYWLSLIAFLTTTSIF